jgi:lysophospholipase L1-like esterase
MKRKINFPNYLVSAISFIVVWLIMELICSVVYKNLPDRFSNGKRIVELNLGNVPEPPASIISHPYMLYANNPNYKDGVQQHNSLGYRGEEFSYVKSPNTIRILALGGSTTYGYLNKDPKTTWPALLQKMLQPHTSKKVEVINGGIKYGTSAELLSAFVFRHRYLEPDIVIFHEGGNDAIPVLFPDYNPEYTHFRGHGSGAQLRTGEKFLLHSNVFKVFYSLWLTSYETVYKAQPYPLTELNRKEAAQRVNDDRNFTGFKRNVELLIRLSQMDSAKIVLFGFVQAREENLSKNRPDHIGLEKTVVRCVEKNKDIMETLAHQYQTLYVEADQDLFKDEWFLDNCHLSPEGEAAKAKLISEYLIPMLPQSMVQN